MTRSALGVLIMVVLLLPGPLTLRAKASDVVAVAELLRNPSFERDSDGDGIPSRWIPKNLGPDDVLVTDAFDGTYSFRIVGEKGIEKSLHQTIKMRIPSGTRLEFSAFSKADGASRGGVGGAYKIKVVLLFEDNTSYTMFGRFSRGTHDWETAAGGGFRFFKDIVKTTVTIAYNDQTGTAWFDLTHFGVGEP